MKRYFILLITLLLLSGCASSNRLPKFPDAPESIQVNCSDLQLVKEDEKKMSEVLQVVVTNYGRYHECKIKTDAWIQWYNIQKEIYGGIK